MPPCFSHAAHVHAAAAAAHDDARDRWRTIIHVEAQIAARDVFRQLIAMMPPRPASYILFEIRPLITRHADVFILLFIYEAEMLRRCPRCLSRYALRHGHASTCCRDDRHDVR